VTLWLVLASSVWGLRVATAGLYGRGEARIQIQSAASRITNYELFFNRCAAVQAAEARTEELESQLALQEEDSRSWNITLTSLTGIRSQRAESIAQYNADAAKDYTRGQFRDSDLPYTLILEEENTRCAN
jgi:hypothetical protein